MIYTIKIIQVAISVVLTGLILVQSRGGGLSSAVSVGGGYRSRRGLEKVIFYSTIILGIAFSLNSVWMLYLTE
jgi:protein translocase SecG subunit